MSHSYFAIGSMINPVSLKGRDLVPQKSEPAVLLDHKLYFFGEMGMAEAIACEGLSFHGVIHTADDDFMAKLDKIEMSYNRKTAKAQLYDGSIREVTVYCRPEDIPRNPEVDWHPTQRYLEIIMEGCKHFGVKAEYIDWLRSHPN